MLLNNSRATMFFVLVGALFVIAVGFLIFGGAAYSKQKKTVESYWKTSCLVTKCIHFQPKYDQVTYESQGGFATIEGSCLIPNGCATHPVNSTFVCYVNAESLIFALPSPAASIALFTIGGIAATACFITGLTWGIMHLCDKRTLKATATAVKAAPPKPTANKLVIPTPDDSWEDRMNRETQYIRRSGTLGAGQ